MKNAIKNELYYLCVLYFGTIQKKHRFEMQINKKIFSNKNKTYILLNIFCTCLNRLKT